LAVFAPLVVTVALGSEYDGAVVLLRVLSIAGLVSVMSNFVGTLMVATKRTRTLFIQNFLALSLNFGGNVWLLPRVGVIASAWLTAATELLVCVGALLVMTRQVDFRGAIRISWRPVVAMGAAAAAGFALPGAQGPALLVASLVYAAIVTLTHGWPDELVDLVRRLPQPRRRTS
jgi:O-antigen/teichoic acid export membrane protein